MTRISLRLSLSLILLFTAVLSLIRAQPYDDHELRELLLPPGCPAPCFMGIRPGVTTVEEAVKILKGSGWVQDYRFDSLIFTLKWNNNSPYWLMNDGLYGGSSIRIEAELVSAFALDTRLTLGEVQLGLGRSPFQYVSVGEREGHTYLVYSAAYTSVGIVITVSNSCDGEQLGIAYHDRVLLTYTKFDSEPGLALDHFDDSWRDLLRASCN